MFEQEFLIERVPDLMIELAVLVILVLVLMAFVEFDADFEIFLVDLMALEECEVVLWV